MRHHKETMVSALDKIPSGAFWVDQFPGSKSIDDLESGFRARFLLFKKAMEDAQIHVQITATFRPKERAYLMHFSWLIVKGAVAPRDVPDMDGVDILWDHANAMQGAQEMVNGFGIGNLGTAPALASRHTEGKAVDTHLSWTGDVTIKDANDTDLAIQGTPRDATHPTLIAVGATYGVIHFTPPNKDKVHWSSDGR